MFIKIRKLELKYKDVGAVQHCDNQESCSKSMDESNEPIGVYIEYTLMLNDSQLEGHTEIDKEEFTRERMMDWELWRFNNYLFKNIMKSI